MNKTFQQRSLIIGILLSLLFGIFTFVVSQDALTQSDFNTTVKLQDNLPGTLSLPFSILSVLGSAEVTGVAWLIATTLLVFKRKIVSILGMLLFPLGTLIELLGKIFIHHPGPPNLFYRGVLDVDLPSHYVGVEYAYPSGHVFRTTFLLIFFIMILLLQSGRYKTLKLIALSGILILMVISRVYLGEHWLSDVIGGLLLGSSFGIFAALATRLRITNQKPYLATH